MNICSFENFYMVNIRGNDVTNCRDLTTEQNYERVGLFNPLSLKVTNL